MSRNVIDRNDIQFPSLSPGIAGQCLRMVEIALAHGNREEAIAAVNRAFAHTGDPEAATTLDSPVVALGLGGRITNALENIGVQTIGDLCRHTPRQLRTAGFWSIGERAMGMINDALEPLGYSLASEEAA